jgi:hypothetical protein
MEQSQIIWRRAAIKQSRFTDAQIIGILKQAEEGMNSKSLVNQKNLLRQDFLYVQILV